MLKLKEIKNKLNQMKVEYEISDDNQKIYILSCNIGDNFYDYDEAPRPTVFNKKFDFLKNDKRIEIIKCDECCGCAGW